MDNQIVDFEIDTDETPGRGWCIYAILENRIDGKKKWGRKMLSTNKVKIRSGLEHSEAKERLAFYKMALDMKFDVDRAFKMISGEKVEINENLKCTFVDAQNEFSFWGN